MAEEDFTIVSVNVKDIRFPTSLYKDGSDAMENIVVIPKDLLDAYAQHADPDYSCAYTVITIGNGTSGYGLTFTLGRGTEVVVQAIKLLTYLVVNKNVKTIFNSFSSFWRSLTSEGQLRWLGPEKGVIHLATASIVNALWDLWARLEGKPLWKLLCDMEPEKLVSTIDFRYLEEVLTPEECVKMLEESRKQRMIREEEMKSRGYPAYTTQIGWLGYPDEKVASLCRMYKEQGFTAFKMKVGGCLVDDVRRCEVIRKEIGEENLLMMDANQVWNVDEACVWMEALARFKPYWIEEPTSPDDILGHARIAGKLNPLGIKVAGGEMCANRVMFKQFLLSKSLQICQIDAARIGGVNEILSVYFMAKKFNVPVCPHAGGVGLCEMVQHLQIFDYICLSGTTEGRLIEYVDQQHEHFEDPVEVKDAAYQAPLAPGYSTKLKKSAVENFEYPNGKEWERIFISGILELRV